MYTVHTFLICTAVSTANYERLRHHAKFPGYLTLCVPEFSLACSVVSGSPKVRLQTSKTVRQWLRQFRRPVLRILHEEVASLLLYFF